MDTIQGVVGERAVWPVPPAAPYQGDGFTSDYRERLYPGLMDNYYRVIEKIISSVGSQCQSSSGGCPGLLSRGGICCGHVCPRVQRFGCIQSVCDGFHGGVKRRVEVGDSCDDVVAEGVKYECMVGQTCSSTGADSIGLLESGEKVGCEANVLDSSSCARTANVAPQFGEYVVCGAQVNAAEGIFRDSHDCSASGESRKLAGETIRVLGESKTERNRRWKREYKEKKKRKQDKLDSWSQLGRERLSSVKSVDLASSDAKRTLEEKWIIQNELEKEKLHHQQGLWIAQNELETEQVRRKLELLKASSLEDDVRRQTTMVKKQIESNMVAIEKTHRYLSATGNVAGEPAGGHGFAKTIISGSNTISPDSSASMKEFRDMQKRLLDVESRGAELEAENLRLRNGIKDVGMDPDLIDVYRKSDWTVDEHGNFPETSLKKLDEMYPDGFMTDCMTEARRVNGKITLGITPATGEPVLGGQFKEPESAFDRVSVEQIVAGVDGSGFPIDTNGVRYTRETAGKWIEMWSHLRQHVSLFKDEEQMAADAKTSVSVIRKYIRLKERFNL